MRDGARMMLAGGRILPAFAQQKAGDIPTIGKFGITGNRLTTGLQGLLPAAQHA